MNWAGDFAQSHIDPSNSVLDLGCGIMQATLDVIANYPPTRLQCRELVGVDIYEPYLDFLQEQGIKVVKHDLTVLPYPFEDNSYDVVLLMDILEHLPLEEAAALEREATRIARKKVIVMTPQAFDVNMASASAPVHCYDRAAERSFGINEKQQHQCLISKQWLLTRGYKVACKHKLWISVKRLYLRILHVWDQAGVATLMVIHQRRLGHEADLIKLEEFASVGMEKLYGFSLIPVPVIDDTQIHRQVLNRLPSSIRSWLRTLRRKIRSCSFYIKVAKAGRRYDVIHLHSVWIAIFFLPAKKMVLEFHGDDVRSEPSLYPKLKRFLLRCFVSVYSLFSKIYVSTPDLLPDVPNSEWLPNPVDPEHFSRSKKPIPKFALYLHNWYETGHHALKFAQEHGLHLWVLDRTKHQWIPHSELPAFMSDFEYFIDRKEIPSHSKTGLEALAMGLKVVQGWNDKIVQGLDPMHRPENVAAKTVEIYRSLLH